jgi:activator of 2-hydroxyglutaryl-CoA dehydratase
MMKEKKLFMDKHDNIEAAMAKVAETLAPTKKANTGVESGATATKQVLIRVSEEDHERWKEASDRDGSTLSDFLRKAANAAASDVLDCKHPRQFRKSFPWVEKCVQCGFVFRSSAAKPK